MRDLCTVNNPNVQLRVRVILWGFLVFAWFVSLAILPKAATAGGKDVVNAANPLNSASSETLQKHRTQQDYLVAEARQLWHRGQRWEAIAMLKQAIQSDPSRGDIYIELAESYMGVERRDLARATLIEAVKTNPNYAPAPPKTRRLL